MGDGDLRGAIGRTLADLEVGTTERPGAVVAIDGPDECLVVSRGVTDLDRGTPLSGDHGFRIASCTKTFVASVVVDLAAGGALDLDGAAIEVSPPVVASALAEYEYGREVTVRQLLHHRSGLVDHTETADFQQIQLDSGRNHEWTPEEQLALAFRHPPRFEPGAAFAYSDSGYVLLGQIVEHLRGGSLPAAVRSTCRLDHLDVPSIHWERFESPPSHLERAHQYLDGEDTVTWNPTVDLYGGGGLVAAMPDLARWWTALFDGSVHDHLDAMTASPQPSVGPDGNDGGAAIGVGMFRHEFDGAEAWGHSGFWGLWCGHVPAAQTSVALVVTGRRRDETGVLATLVASVVGALTT